MTDLQQYSACVVAEEMGEHIAATPQMVWLDSIARVRTERRCGLREARDAVVSAIRARRLDATRG